MKPKNFPARKLLRQLKAQGVEWSEIQRRVTEERKVRTKKSRSAKG